MPKKATFVSLSPFLAQSSYNPWNFLKEESYQSVFYYVNEAAFGPHLRMRVGCLDSQPCDYKVGAFCPTSRHPRAPGRGDGLDAEPPITMIEWTTPRWWRLHVAVGLSRVWLFATPQTVACQAFLFMGFSQQKYWNGLPLPPLVDLPDPGIQSTGDGVTCIAGRFFPTEPSRKPWVCDYKSSNPTDSWLPSL